MNPRCGAGHPFLDRFGCAYRNLGDEKSAHEWARQRGISHYWIPCQTLLATAWVRRGMAAPVLTAAEANGKTLGTPCNCPDCRERHRCGGI